MYLEKLMFYCLVFENMLRMYKTQLYHELKLEESKKKETLNEYNRRDRKEIEKTINKVIGEYNKVLKRSDMYNSEVTDMYVKANPDFDTEKFIEQINDFYIDFTDLLLKVSNKKGVNIEPAILELSESGNIFINNGKYKIHTK